MIFEDKINRSLSENERNDKNGNHLEPFPLSAIHFLRNRLLPTGIEGVDLRQSTVTT